MPAHEPMPPRTGHDQGLEHGRTLSARASSAACRWRLGDGSDNRGGVLWIAQEGAVVEQDGGAVVVLGSRVVPSPRPDVVIVGPREAGLARRPEERCDSSGSLHREPQLGG